MFPSSLIRSTLIALTISYGSIATGEPPTIGWDGDGLDTSGNAIPAYASAGIEAFLRPSNRGVNRHNGSTDGTFGSSYTGAETAFGSYLVSGNDNVPGNGLIEISVTNNTGTSIQMDRLMFDYARWFNGSPRRLDVTYRSADLGVTDYVQIASYEDIVVETVRSDYSDYAIDLTQLSESILADGESVQFQLIATIASGETSGGGLDNIGLTFLPATKAAIPYVAWDGAAIPSHVMDGVHAELTPSTRGIDTISGSADGFFGSEDGIDDAETVPGAYRVTADLANPEQGIVRLTVTNNSSSALNLNSLLFDYSRFYPNSPQDITVSYESGNLVSVEAPTVIATFNVETPTGPTGNYRDFRVSLEGLADTGLASGQHAVFALQVSNANTPWARGAFDNIAITFDNFPTAFGVWSDGQLVGVSLIW